MVRKGTNPKTGKYSRKKGKKMSKKDKGGKTVKKIRRLREVPSLKKAYSPPGTKKLNSKVFGSGVPKYLSSGALSLSALKKRIPKKGLLDPSLRKGGGFGIGTKKLSGY